MNWAKRRCISIRERRNEILFFCEFSEYIRGYDIDGQESLWVITSGSVCTLALIDANNDGKNEIVCGCDNGIIKIYQNDSLLMEFFENSCVIHLTKIGMVSTLSQSQCVNAGCI